MSCKQEEIRALEAGSTERENSGAQQPNAASVSLQDVDAFEAKAQGGMVETERDRLIRIVSIHPTLYPILKD